MKKMIFIAGGGTGGHIYPGIAIARRLLEIDPQIEIHFVGAREGLEEKIIPREGFQLHLIAGGKLNFSGQIFRKIKTLVMVPVGLLQSARLILKYKPAYVLGVGGYASGPFVLMASLLGCRTAIWEPNAWPGLANRWLSHFVNRCFVVFSQAQEKLKNKNIKILGMPVRAEIEKGFSDGDESGHSADGDTFHLLCFGGSLGSRPINKVLSELMKKNEPWMSKLKVVHQIGSTDWEFYKKTYVGQCPQVDVFEFLHDMPARYQWADLVLCRGGASTISEIAAFGVPAVIVPLPAADDHQVHNAESVVRADGGVMILQKDLTVEKLSQELQYWIKNKEQLKTKSAHIKKVFKPRAALSIAEDLLKEIAE